MLAFRPEEEAQNIIEKSDRQKHTPNTITDVDLIMHEISDVKKKGYCITDQELITADIYIAAPIFDSNGQAVATVTASGPKSKWSKKDLEDEVAYLVMETAKAISV